MPYTFDWIDAFSQVPFGGNGCVVVHDAQSISIEDRLNLVRETSLAECAYLVPSSKADFGVRYYLADKEIPMAGHPTIATVQSLLHRGLVANGTNFSLEVGAGVLPISVSDDGLITMTQMRPTFGNCPDPERIAGMYGLSQSDIAHQPQVVSTGTPFCITVLASKDALRRAVLDVDALNSFRDESGESRADCMEPFLVTLGGETSKGDTFSRLLLAPPSLPEDPFTGSATGCMAAYLWHHNLISTPNFTAEQGHWMGRPGSAEVSVRGLPNDISGVDVSGRGTLVMSGELRI